MVKSAWDSMGHFLHQLDLDNRKNKMTWMSSFKDLIKKTLHGLQSNMLKSTAFGVEVHNVYIRRQYRELMFYYNDSFMRN